MLHTRAVFVGFFGMLGSPVYAANTEPLDGADAPAVAIAPTHPGPVQSALKDCASCHEGENTQSFVPFDTTQFQVDVPSRAGLWNTPAMPQSLDLPEPEPEPVVAANHRIGIEPVVVDGADKKIPLPLLLGALALATVALGVAGVRYINGLAREREKLEEGEMDAIDPNDLELLKNDADPTTAETDPEQVMAKLMQENSFMMNLGLITSWVNERRKTPLEALEEIRATLRESDEYHHPFHPAEFMLALQLTSQLRDAHMRLNSHQIQVDTSAFDALSLEFIQRLQAFKPATPKTPATT